MGWKGGFFLTSPPFPFNHVPPGQTGCQLCEATFEYSHWNLDNVLTPCGGCLLRLPLRKGDEMSAPSYLLREGKKGDETFQMLA